MAVGAQTWLWVWLGLSIMRFLISCSLVPEDKPLLCPLPVPNQTQKLGCVGGGRHLSPVSRLWGWSVCPPPYLPFRFCFYCKPHDSPVVAKLICKSCAPYPPQTRHREIKKSPRLLLCWAYVIGLGWMKSTKYRGTHAQCFLRCELDCFYSSIFISKLKPPLHPHMGSVVFSDHWADSDLRCNGCALLPPPPFPPPPFPPPHGNFAKAPRGRQGNANQ